MHFTDDFQIRLYRGASFETLGLAEYNALADDERHALPDPGKHVTLQLVIDGEDRFYARGFGPLASLVAQLAPAQARLAAGAPALIRSGVVDVADGQYVLFEPIDDAAVQVSKIAFDQHPACAWFPDARDGEALYRFVAEQRAGLIAAARDAWPELVEIAMDRARLVTALAREAGFAAAVLDGRS